MSTTTRPVARPFAVLKLPEYQVPRLVTVARAIVSAMTKNPRFPSPNPPLATVEAAIAALEEAEVATLGRAPGSVALRDSKRLAVVVLLQQLRDHVQATADADIEEGPAIIESAGMSVKRQRGAQERALVARLGPVSGSVKLSAPKAGNRAGYEWAYSTDGQRTWVSVPITVQASTTISGLAPGSTVHFRYRATSKLVTGDWSDSVSTIVD
ncbi:MAG: fibronectin type III domain-containing protein [Polyangiaceae bacterium]